MSDSLKKIVDKILDEKVLRVVFENGMTVVAKEDYSSEVMSAQIWVKTGSIHEEDFLGAGISHYLEHMIFKGTEKRDYKKISDDVQSLGCNINAYTTFDRTVYYIDGPSEAAEDSIEILSDIVFNSKIDTKEATSERDVILREIDMGLDDPDRQLSKALFKEAFREHPYRYPVIGERSLFEDIKPKDIKEYYEKHYVPSNMVFVFVGPYSEKQILDYARKYLSKQENKSLNPVLLPQEPVQFSKRESRIFGDYKIVRGALTFPIPALKHEDFASISVLANVLGQGSSSLFFQELREKKKYIHHVSASVWNPGPRGMFFISYVCDEGSREKVEKDIFALLNKYKKAPISSKLVGKSLRQSMVGEINSRKTMSGQAAKLGISEVVVKDSNFSRYFLKKLEKVSAKQLAVAIKKYLDEEKATIISLEPEAKEKKAAAKKEDLNKLPDFEEVVLKNGVRILLQHYPLLPKTHIRAIMRGGPMFEDPKQRGITGVLATLLTKDTEKHSSKKIAETIETIGGLFSEFTGNNTFGLSLEVLPTDFNIANDLLKNALLAPKFSKKHLDIERDAQIASIREELDDVASYGARELRKKFFGKYPYCYDSFGSIKCLESLTLKDLNGLKKQLIASNNLVISVSGDFDKKSIVKKISTWASKLAPNKDFEAPLKKFKGPKASDSEKKMKREQVVLFEAYPCVGVTSKELEVTELLDEIFSGMSSNLFTQVREKKGMAYFVGSGRMLGFNTGMFYFYSGTSQENYSKVFKEINAELKRIKTGKITDAEIKRSKIRLKAANRMSLQTPGARAMQSGLNAIYGLPINEWRIYSNKIDKISKKDLVNFANKYFDEAKKVRFSVGDVK